MGIFSKNKYYIRLYINRVEIKDLVNKKSISEKSQVHFNSQRLMIADFDAAEKFIHSVFKKNKLSTKNAVGIIQQMEMSEGGLSMIEKRILLELFSGIGINEIHVDESLMNLTQKQLIEYKK